MTALAQDELAQWAEVGRSEHFDAQSLCLVHNHFKTRLQLPQPLYGSIETPPLILHASH